MKAAVPAIVSIRRERAAPRRPWWRRWRLWVITLDVLVLGAALAAQRWPVLKIRQVVINGPSIWESRILGVVQTSLPVDSNIFSVNTGDLQARLAAEFGSLATCRAGLALPGILSIDVVPTPLTLWTESGMGVGVDGSLLVTPAVEKTAPIWRRAPGDGDGSPVMDRSHAAGAWAEVTAADPRFTGAISEWGWNPRTGWTMVGIDGQTRVHLGWNDLTARALNVSTLLGRSDTVLTQPCVVDARFDGQMIVSRNPRPAGTDSDSAVATESRRVSVASATPAKVTAKHSPKPEMKTMTKDTVKVKAKAKDRSKSKHVHRGGV